MPKSSAAVGRDATINIRAQRRQRDLIDRAAAALGKNRSDFMLESACRAAEDVLLDRRVLQLAPADWAAFEALLDAPPRDDARLRALLARRPPWEP